MITWYECQDCVYATNDKTKAAEHIRETGHKMKEDED